MRTAFVILVLLASHIPCRAGDDRPHGRIVFDAMIHDFGIAQQHAELQHVFQFRNAGAGVLKIDRVHAGCGCTAVSLAQKQIEPGKTGSMSATLKTENSEGGIVKTIQVFTNDPENKSVALQLKATVAPEIACSPLHLDFGEVPAGGTPELSVKVTSPGGRQFSVKGATASASFVKARVQASGDGSTLVFASISDAPSPGPFSGTIVISADVNGKSRDLKVTFGGSIPARTYAVPSKLLFGVVEPGESPSREVAVRANGWKGLKVESVHVGDGLSTSVEEIDPGKEWKITVRIVGSPPPGLLKSELRIAVNDPLVKEIIVPVYAVVRDGR